LFAGSIDETAKAVILEGLRSVRTLLAAEQAETQKVTDCLCEPSAFFCWLTTTDTRLLTLVVVAGS
jgi:hypothetical protein